ncbi:MAG: hypothetical protein AB7O31_12040 [Burkholderiales bacterium]
MDALLLAVTLALAAPATSPEYSALVRECGEGGDFVRNAAYSRDAGMTRAAFLQRLHDDFAAIRGLPASLRWFVRTPEDEIFLAAEVARVFDAPDDGNAHRKGFISRCMQRIGPSAG